MKKLCKAFFLSLLLLPLLVSAEIVLRRPAESAVVSAIAPELKEFLLAPTAERRELFNDKAYRARLNLMRDAVPTEFGWECTEGETGKFVMVVSDRADFSTPTQVLVRQPESGVPAASAVNFMIGKTYYWKVVCTAADGTVSESAVGSFSTEDFAPRLLRVDNVGNVRDLGGRIGLDGRRIRQGMIYRTAGLNENSPDFSWDSREWKIPLSEFRIGKPRITEAAAVYVREVLGVKTDLDLRSDGEVASMNASPAGDGVNWVHRSSSGYGDIFKSQIGRDAMAANFRLFCDPVNYPVLFHCIAGADRTGALAYVLNAVLGVPADELEKDWEITANSYFSYPGMFDDLSGGFDNFGTAETPLSEKAALYLQSIGVTPEEIAAFRAIMLE